MSIVDGITGLNSAFATGGIDNLQTSKVRNSIPVDASLWNTLADTICSVERKLCTTATTTGGSRLIHKLAGPRIEALGGALWKKVLLTTYDVICNTEVTSAEFTLPIICTQYEAGTPPLPERNESLSWRDLRYSVSSTGATVYPLVVELLSTPTTTRIDTTSIKTELSLLLKPQGYGWKDAPTIPEGKYIVKVFGCTIPTD